MGADELPIFLRHPELHHYTDWGGLSGIFRSNQVWATHFESLNDFREVWHLREPLEELLLARLVRKERRRLDGQTFASSLPLSAMIDAISWLVDRMYEVTFRDSGRSAPLAFPFISCFCSHSADEEYERNNGLLSQWRGYGGECSYCLVFDTEELFRLLQPEGRAHDYSVLTMLPVVYDDSRFHWEDFAEELLPHLDNAVVAKLKQEEEVPEDLFNAVVPFVHMACRFKHRAFSEEREIRIVASPFTPESAARFSPGGKATTSSCHGFKAVHGIGATRRLWLFEKIQARLPIKRVIVGPSPDQRLAVEEAKQLLPTHIEVVPSATPYRGK